MIFFEMILTEGQFFSIMAQIISVFEVLVDKFIAKLAAHQVSDGSSDDIEAKKKEFASIWKSCVNTASVSVAWSDDDGGVTEIKPKKKATKKTTPDETVPDSVSDDGVADESGKCVYVATKGKSKGVACGKKTAPGKKMCQSHKKAEDDVVREETDAPIFGPQNKEDSGDAVESKKCAYVPTRGKTKGVACGNTVVDGSDTCSKHAKKSTDTEADSDTEKKTQETKVRVVMKQNGRWVHVESGFVFKSNKDRVVVGKMTDGEYRDINADDIADLEKYSFEYELN